MSEGVTFDGEEQFNSVTPVGYGVPVAPPGLIGWVLKTGIVKTAQGAKVLLLALTIVSIILSIYLLSHSSTKNTLTQEQLQAMKDEHPVTP